MVKKRKTWFLTGGAAVIAALAAAAVIFFSHNSKADEGQHLEREQAYRFENESVYAVFAPEDGNYELLIEGTGSEAFLLQINGIAYEGEIEKGKALITLHKGINSVSLTDVVEDEDDGVTGITVIGCPAYPEVGAFAAYVTYEAEDGETNAVISEENRDYRDFASEASGRRYVALETAGDYVTVKLTEPADALVVRYCIPDSEDGQGLTGTVDLLVDGKQREVTLTSEYSWVYGEFPWNNDPSTSNKGGGHHFYDDVRVRLDQVYPVGTEITIRKGDTFEYCLIDLIEAEEVGAPIPMPENALSVEDFGAIPNDGKDDSFAIMDCIAEAAAQGKEVYIPAGEFEIMDHPYVNGIWLRDDHITICGAGMWHTVLKGDAAGFAIQAGHIYFYDFSLIGNVKQRKDSIDPPAFNLTMPKAGIEDIRLQNVWIEHYKVGLWADVVNGISIMGCRIRNTYADGINLCAGTSYSMVTQNDLRNTGDDGIAMFNRGILCVGNKVTYNTVSLPWLANNIALYGGKDIEISHNLLKDTICFGSGVNISTNFTPQVFEGTIIVEENRLVRCGGREYNINADYGAVWINTIEGYDNKAECIVRNNTIEDSTYQGVSFFNGGVVENMQIIDNVITGCGTYGFEIGAEAKGSAIIRNNTVTNTGTGELQNLSSGGFTVLD